MPHLADPSAIRSRPASVALGELTIAAGMIGHSLTIACDFPANVLCQIWKYHAETLGQLVEGLRMGFAGAVEGDQRILQRLALEQVRDQAAVLFLDDADLVVEVLFPTLDLLLLDRAVTRGMRAFPEAPGKGVGQGGLADAGDVLEKDVAPGEECGQGHAYDVPFSMENPLHLAHQVFEESQL